jgi:hypothetical protein
MREWLVHSGEGGVGEHLQRLLGLSRPQIMNKSIIDEWNGSRDRRVHFKKRK